jgi:hypothetical protein
MAGACRKAAPPWSYFFGHFGHSSIHCLLDVRNEIGVSGQLTSLPRRTVVFSSTRSNANLDGRPIVGDWFAVFVDEPHLGLAARFKNDVRRAKIKQKRRTCGHRCRPLPPPRRGADQAWKEFKVVYFYDEDLRHQHVAVTHQNHEAAGRLLRREANRLGFRQACERIANVDGAPWIRQQLELHLAELDGLGLDFYHLAKNMHRARRAVFGEDSAAAKAWGDQLMHSFKHDGYDAAWEQLTQWRATLARSPRKRKAANRLLEYVSARREMIRYPEFRASGWQIGSGPTEAQCKLTVGRLKGRSRRWDRPNAAAIAALDSLERSGQWKKYFLNTDATAA